MSAQLAPRSQPRPGRSERPRLRPVSVPPGRLATVPFVLVIALVLAAGMVGMLVLTTNLQNQAFAVESSQRQANELAAKMSLLQAQVADARSVESLASAAQKLGMRPNPYVAQLRLSDGKVIGKAQRVTGNEFPVTKESTTQKSTTQKTDTKATPATETTKKAVSQ